MMSQQALGSKRVQDGLRDVLLRPGKLYEASAIVMLGSVAMRSPRANSTLG